MTLRFLALVATALAPLTSFAAQLANAPQFGAFGIDLVARDANIRPGDDF